MNIYDLKRPTSANGFSTRLKGKGKGKRLKSDPGTPPNSSDSDDKDYLTVENGYHYHSDKLINLEDVTDRLNNTGVTTNNFSTMISSDYDGIEDIEQEQSPPDYDSYLKLDGASTKSPMFKIGEESDSSCTTETSHFVFPDVESVSSTVVVDLAKPAQLGVRCYNNLYASDDEDTIGGVSSFNTTSVDGNKAGFTRRQWLTLLVFGFVEFFSAVVISLQAPFYPAEAEKKGATATEYGFVFGVFELVVFIVSPIYGAYMNKIGPKLLFNVGIFTTATCSILFGFLDKVDLRVEFISLSMLTRIVEATGDAAFVTASFVIIAAEFPDSIATSFASMETFYGLGLIVGPTAGGALYQWGGYMAPFVIIGGLLFVTAIFTYFVMPTTPSAVESSSHGFEIFNILKIPTIAVCAISIAISAASAGFLSAILEPHLRQQFDLSPVITGVVFIVSGGMYALSAPVWGWLCDKMAEPKNITQIGSLLIMAGFILIGPAPYIPLDSALWITVVGLLLHGLGLGATLVSSFIIALRDTVAHGFPDDINTYGSVSALWASMFALGSFIGPSAAGILFDTVGFRMGTLLILGMQFFMSILVGIVICKPITRGQASHNFNQNNASDCQNETEPLLPLQSVTRDRPSTYGSNAQT